MTMTKRALILGGHGDIGRAIDEELKIKHKCETVPVGRAEFDLTKTDSIDAFLDQSGYAFDVLIHCAGWNEPKIFELLTMKEIEHSINANLMGFLYLAKKILPHWKSQQQGSIVVISSLYGTLARKGRLPYVTAKHALLGVVKTLSIELAEYGVPVNAVSPGYINTKMTSKNNTQETIERLVGGIPLGRMGTPQEVAKAVGFLAGEENTYITGQNLIIDGGYSAGGFQN